MSYPKTIFRHLREDRGNVESALVLIPLLILFLIGMQISLAIHARNVGRVEAQNSASVRAISGEFEPSDRFIHIESSGDGQNLDLLITRREATVLSLLPGFVTGSSSTREVDVGGVAVVENSR
jgi:hypothetical protein